MTDEAAEKVLTREEFVRDLKEAVADPAARAKYAAAKLEFQGLAEKVRPFDAILCEHMQEVERAFVNMEKYIFMMYK